MIILYQGRHIDELRMVPLSEWSLEELSYHHFMMSQMSPWMNQQGVSFHHQLIGEIERRGNISTINEAHYPPYD